MVAAPKPRPSSRWLPRRLSERLDTARRDLSMVAGTLFAGRSAPHLVPRARSPRAASAPPTSAASRLAPRPMRVTRIVRETPDAVSVFLEDPRGKLEFLPGEFLTVEVTVDGEKLRRAYSLSTSPLDGEASITVKRVEGGRVSGFINDGLKEGDVLHVLGPSGNFTVETTPDARRHLVLLAGGSGITPIMSIARSVLAAEPKSDVTLVYGNRSERDVIFRDALDALAAEHEGRLRLDHVLSDPEGEWKGARGMLDRPTVEARLAALGIEDDSGIEYFLCGPEPMRAAVRETLEARGVPARRIREEIFVRPELQSAGGASPLPTEAQTVHVRQGAVERTMLVKPGHTVLEAGLDAGVDMPFSCTMGGCAACKVKLVDGDVAMEEPNCLTAEEREQGYILACVSRPTKRCRVEVE